MLQTNQSISAWISLNRWCDARKLRSPSRLATSQSPGFLLNSTNGSFYLRVGSQLASWNGIQVRLGYAPQLIDN